MYIINTVHVINFLSEEGFNYWVEGAARDTVSAFKVSKGI